MVINDTDEGNIEVFSWKLHGLCESSRLVLRDYVENRLEICFQAERIDQFLLSARLTPHNVYSWLLSSLSFLLIEINNSLIHLEYLIDLLIPNKQKFNILKILLIDIQFLIDLVIDLKQSLLLGIQFFVVYLSSIVLAELKLDAIMTKYVYGYDPNFISIFSRMLITWFSLTCF